MKVVLYCLLTLFMIQPAKAGRHWIIFYAYPALYDVPTDGKSQTGHAFVAFVKDNPETRQTEIIATLGFNPRALPDWPWSKVPGDVMDDSKVLFAPTNLSVEVSKSEFDAAFAVQKKWRGKPYVPDGANCVDFMKDVVKCIAPLVVPEDSYRFPNPFVKRLRELNPNISNRSVPYTEQPAPTKTSRQEVIKAAIDFFHWYQDVWQKKYTKIPVINYKIVKKQGIKECPCRINPAGINELFTWLLCNKHFFGLEYLRTFRKLLVDTDNELQTAKTEIQNEELLETLYSQSLNIFPTQDIPNFQKAGFFNPIGRWGVMLISDEIATVDTPAFLWDGKPSIFTLTLVKENGRWMLNNNASFRQGK